MIKKMHYLAIIKEITTFMVIFSLRPRYPNWPYLIDLSLNPYSWNGFRTRNSFSFHANKDMRYIKKSHGH